ncbi:MAG: DNA-directed RNA polymerase [Candidatus Methanomethylicota archaeon]|jgi:DNA-directed RNA polymerase subunit E'|uniref:DNA-directed RNA polymerase subunit Rpo7 n=1 Tax=Thermoproteota archaeon TaxID=2056631 RepID=A0A523BIK8_9CREN|nr:MAG: DNA-directed RNA polymerase [Candidatus Verstraetearchaeota archaeon]
MFKLLQVNDVVRIPPDKFDSPLEAVATEVLRATYEGTVSRELGIIIAVLNVKVSDVGKILPGNGGVYHKVSFDLLVFIPVIQEVIEGEVVDVTDFGVFVRIGPIDGLIHISQIMDDFITYDEKRGALIGKETHRVLEKGMIVRARIVTISLSSGPSRSSKIGLTMRQPFLGAISWIEEDINKSTKEIKKEGK